MDLREAALVLSALALEGRLAVYRLLIRHGPGGLAAGEIQKAVDAAASTLSANLNVLKAAGLVEDRREGRFIYYTARYDRMRDLLAFLLEDCCGGSPEVCMPLVDIATRAACCADDQAEHDEALK